MFESTRANILFGALCVIAFFAPWIFYELIGEKLLLDYVERQTKQAVHEVLQEELGDNYETRR